MVARGDPCDGSMGIDDLKHGQQGLCVAQQKSLWDVGEKDFQRYGTLGDKF
jgi:hypothetical protein